MRREKGITLVALIITIIVLVILVGVSIGAMLNSGIIKNTETATTEYNKQEATEIINLKITKIQMETYAQQQKMPTLQMLASALYKDKTEIQYVHTSKRVASTVDIDDIDIGEATSIYTKLKAYPYEFEIDSSLRLASIDGVKIATTNPTEGSNEMCTPIKLVTAVLPYTEENKLNKGTYAASNSLYEKNNEEQFSKYLSFEENKGWTILKSGWYSFYVDSTATYVDTAASLVSEIIINGDSRIMDRAYLSSSQKAGCNNGNVSIYLTKGTVVDYYFILPATESWVYSDFGIYAMFQ